MTDDRRARPWSAVWRGSALEIHHACGEVRPQLAVLHADSGYLRLSTGPRCAWGTSVIVLPSLWSGGRYHQGATLRVRYADDGDDCLVAFTGTIASLTVRGEIRLRPPVHDGLVALVSVEAQGAVRLDRRDGEAFKPVALSSMRVSDTLWDAERILVDDRTIDVAEHGWLVGPAVVGGRFGFVGGTSRWKARAPTVEVVLDRAMRIAGWRTASADPDDDNLSVWCATDEVPQFWEYRVIARIG